MREQLQEIVINQQEIIDQHDLSDSVTIEELIALSEEFQRKFNGR